MNGIKWFSKLKNTLRFVIESNDCVKIDVLICVCGGRYSILNFC